MRADLSEGVVPHTTRVMNLSHLLTETARRHGDATGLARGERRHGWAALEARAAALAQALIAEYGLAKGDRVLVQATNSAEMVAAMFACWRAGAVWVPANARLMPADLAWLAHAAGARLMICDAAFPDHAAACSPHLDAVIAIGRAGFGPDLDSLVARHRGSAPPAAAVCRDDPAWFFFTSGTTGKPKAAILTHGQLAFVVTNHLCDLMPGTGPGDASLVVAPLSHGAGIHLLAQVARGVPSILPESQTLDPAEIWALVAHWRITNLFTVPTIVKRLVEHPAVDRHDHTSLRYVVYAGAPMYRADQIRALEKLGPVLVQYFGLGEVTGNITVLPPWHHHLEDGRMRIGTCGFARTGMQVQIQDATGRECAPGETGEIAVIGPAVFAGYHDNPEANARAFRNGWFLTGDLGHMDDQGFVYLTGRASDMFISGGSNIHPREIEEALLMHPDLSEAVVLGVPDPDWGEVGLAVCVPRPGAALDPQAVRDWLSGRIARYKLPRHVLFWPELPKSAYGKITRSMIRATLTARGEMPWAGP